MAIWQRRAVDDYSADLVDQTQVVSEAWFCALKIETMAPQARGTNGFMLKQVEWWLSSENDNNHMSEWFFLDTDVNHIAGLCVRSSAIEGNGLFTTKPIHRDQAVGVWTGLEVPGDVWVDDKYGCELKYGDVSAVLTPMENGVLNYAKHPFAAMNEPAPQTTANIYARVEDNDDVGEGDTLIMMVFYASDNILSNAELLWHYGSDYERDYAVGNAGEPVTVPNSTSVRFERMLRHRPDGVVRVSEESESDDSDSEFVP